MRQFFERIALGVRRDWKKSCVAFLAAYGAGWAIVEPINGFITPPPIIGSSKYAMLVGASALAALYYLFPKTKATLPISNSGCSIDVIVGNIFSVKAQRVIPVNDCFDSQLGRIVAPTSLHGQFIARELSAKPAFFDTMVRKPLDRVPSTPKERPDGGKTSSYPIGTTISATANGSVYYLVALAETDGTSSVANATVAQLWLALEGLWEVVRIESNDDDVAVPLIGGGLSRVDLPPSQLLNFILTSFVAETKKQKVTQRLIVVLHPAQLAHIDLDEVESSWRK